MMWTIAEQCLKKFKYNLSLSIRRVWSSVWNAADRSSSTSAISLLESKVFKISFVILKWCCLSVNWRLRKKPYIYDYILEQVLLSFWHGTLGHRGVRWWSSWSPEKSWHRGLKGIAVMHVYVRQVNFTTKSRFQNILKVAKFYVNEFARQYSWKEYPDFLTNGAWW